MERCKPENGIRNDRERCAMNDEPVGQTFITTSYEPKLKKWITRTVECQLLQGGENMAISGGAKPSIELQIIDGVLVVGSSAMRQGALNNIDIAVQELLRGRKVFLQQYGDLQAQVTRTIEATLKGGDRE